MAWFQNELPTLSSWNLDLSVGSKMRTVLRKLRAATLNKYWWNSKQFGCSSSTTWLSLPLGLVALLLAIATPAALAEGEAQKPSVEVIVTPVAIQPSEGVTITGVAPLDGKGPLKVMVQPPGNKPPLNLTVDPVNNGDYHMRFNDTAAPGTYIVNVTTPGGTMGRSSFTVSLLDPESETQRAAQEARAIQKVIRDIEADVDRQIPNLPDNPARDELIKKWNAAKPQLEKTARDLADIDAMLAPLNDAVRRHPELKPLMVPIARSLQDWTRTAQPQRERILREIEKSRRDNVLCENLERITEGFNFASALFNLMGGPVSAVKAVLVDYLAAKVGKKVGDLSALAGFQSAETSKVLMAMADGKISTAVSNYWKGAAEKSSALMDGRNAAINGVGGLLSDLGSFAASQVFGKYCERLAGSFKGMMNADFFASKGGQKWWSYDIVLEGHLDLRYAKATAGSAVAVNGEFIGQATKFTLWEDAIRVGWPKLASSAILHRRNILPVPALVNTLMGAGRGTGASAGSQEHIIDAEGKAASTLMKPYSFFVPVVGEIANGVLTLRMKPATSDYTASARVIYVILSPLALVPVASGYELPYKDANFFFTRVSGDGPMRFKVEKTASALKVSDSVENKKENALAKGRYTLNLNLCNPEDKC